MTPEEFEPLGYFMGYEKQIDAWGGTHWWSDNQDGTAKHIGLVGSKTSLTPAECYEALELLVEKGYVNSELNYHNMNWWAKIQRAGYNATVYLAIKPTIHEAIEQALLDLVAAEEAK